MKMLYIRNVSGIVLNSFSISAILAAKELGIDFTFASNMSMADKESFAQVCDYYGIKAVHIDFDRNPLGKDNLLARKQLLELMEKEKYDIVHCNTPSGGVVGRISAAQAKVPKVIYMAHGFHFWKGAPLKNWLLYYPVERFLAHFSDRLITINHEDYARAQRFRFKKGGRAEYVPGVGVEMEKFARNEEVRAGMRKALGIEKGETVFLSVGEVNENKNQRVVIEALARLKREDIRYVICGENLLTESLRQLAEELGVGGRVIFAGYRTDIEKFYQAADIFIISSFREGLPVAAMEGMAAGIPCVASRIRGNTDLMGGSRLMFEPGDVDGLCSALEKAADAEIAREEIERNRRALKHFSMDKSVGALKRIYVELMDEIASDAAAKKSGAK